jgi:hypothetical protein
MSSLTTEQIAQWALKFGFIPIPLAPGSKRPILPRWQDLTRDKAIAFFSKHKTGHNVGILTGAPSGVVVVDVDSRLDGLKHWTQIANANGIPTTFVVKTGTGYHYYFKYDASVSKLINASNVGGYGIDFKTNGGQVVFAGSIHENGNVYTVVAGMTDGQITLATMPEWLLKFLSGK